MSVSALGFAILLLGPRASTASEKSVIASIGVIALNLLARGVGRMSEKAHLALAGKERDRDGNNRG